MSLVCCEIFTLVGSIPELLNESKYWGPGPVFRAMALRKQKQQERYAEGPACLDAGVCKLAEVAGRKRVLELSSH